MWLGQERFWFCMAPANLRNPVSAAALLRFASKYAAKQAVPADVPWKDQVPQTSEELCELEAAHQVINPLPICHILGVKVYKHDNGSERQR